MFMVRDHPQCGGGGETHGHRWWLHDCPVRPIHRGADPALTATVWASRPARRGGSNAVTPVVRPPSASAAGRE